MNVERRDNVRRSVIIVQLLLVGGGIDEDKTIYHFKMASV